MKPLIVYKGKYGATAQYAKWLSEAYEIPAATITNIGAHVLQNYDTIIIGSSVYVGKLQVRNWLREFADILKNKKLFFFIVSATPANQEATLLNIATSNIPPELYNTAQVFFLPGRLLKARLSWTDRIMLNMGARLQKDKEQGKKMLMDFDEVRTENLAPLIKRLSLVLTQGADSHAVPT